jgi:predicted CopG family antitoxin
MQNIIRKRYDYKTIAVSTENYRTIAAMGTAADNFNDCISKLLKQAKATNTTTTEGSKK